MHYNKCGGKEISVTILACVKSFLHMPDRCVCMETIVLLLLSAVRLNLMTCV